MSSDDQKPGGDLERKRFGRDGKSDKPGKDEPIADMEDPRLQLPETVARNERIVEDGFWPKIRRLLGKVPFLEDAVAAYFCAIDPKTPFQVRAILLAALAYFVLPIDIVPDFFVGFGFTDDATVLLAAMKIVADHITEEHRAKAREVLGKEMKDADEEPPA